MEAGPPSRWTAATPGSSSFLLLAAAALHSPCASLALLSVPRTCTLPTIIPTTAFRPSVPRSADARCRAGRRRPPATATSATGVFGEGNIRGGPNSRPRRRLRRCVALAGQAADRAEQWLPDEEARVEEDSTSSGSGGSGGGGVLVDEAAEGASLTKDDRVVPAAGDDDSVVRAAEEPAMFEEQDEGALFFGDVKADADVEIEEDADADADAAADAESEAAGMVCRVVASSDGKLPTSRSELPPSLFSSLPNGGGADGAGLLERIDAIFHAESHAETRNLGYLDESKRGRAKFRGVGDERTERVDGEGEDEDEDEEGKLVSVLRSALDDAGFELLSRRDLELCEALNAGYLLRLSIAPNLKDLDPAVGMDFYPEMFSSLGGDEEDEKGGATKGIVNRAKRKTPKEDEGNDCDDTGLDPLLFDGRVLIFRRGYSSEVTVGRLLLPKVDYLQAALVQKSAAIVADPLLRLERAVTTEVSRSVGEARGCISSRLAELADSIKIKAVADFVKSKWGWKRRKDDGTEEQLMGAYSLGVYGKAKKEKKKNKKAKDGTSVFRLSRYGGGKRQVVGSPDIRDALDPFLLCEVGAYGGGINGDTISDSEADSAANGAPEVEHDIYAEINVGQIACAYDGSGDSSTGASAKTSPKQLLQRISVSNLVDFFSTEGRRGIVRRFFSKSELVEPTYEEVVVIWRPLQKKPKKPKVPALPNFVYKGAEIFGVDDRLPERPDKSSGPTAPPLEIRAFTDVPMANLLAVLPKTKLIFRPADAFVFDSVSLLSLAAILGSQRYDSPRLDLLALVSVTLWVLRTFIRYSNKLARYDLTVNKFLTSKISHRGPGALRYIAAEAGSQRAVRASLTHAWLVGGNITQSDGVNGDLLTREDIVRVGMDGVNGLIDGDRRSRVNVEAALDDLEEIGLVRFGGEESIHSGSMKGSEINAILREIRTGVAAADSLKAKWEAMFSR